MIFKTDNLFIYYFNVGDRQEFKINYKLPTLKMFKRWWTSLWKRKSKD